MEYYLKVDLSNKTLALFEDIVQEHGILPLWTIEGETYEIALASHNKEKELLHFLGIPFEEKLLPTIDWQKEWSTFAQGKEKEGVFEINFRDLGLNQEGSFKLKAGPGFGNLSHPTTSLMLSMMQGHCTHKSIIDIGSGSGILSIAAANWGAKEVFALDIDPAAMQHTEENILLNQLEERVKVLTPRNLLSYLESSKIHPLILINMIENEQREALPPFISSKSPLTVISSGILTKDKNSYLSWMKEGGFTLINSLEQEEWSGFFFKNLP